MLNCPVTGNSASYNNGAGVYSSTLVNCILYYNGSANYYDDYETLLINCCTTPQPLHSSFIRCFTAPPMFVDLAGGNLRLQANSPCINAGNNSYLTNLFITNRFDLDGNPRIAGGTVDIGAYEFQAPVSRISYNWLQYYGLAINTNTDSADPDGDTVDNYQEWLDGSDPTNSLSSRPVIRTQPTNLLAMAGDNASFLVAVTGTTPLSYEWRFNETNVIPHATNSALIVSNAQSANAGPYSVLVRNIYATVLSSNALLCVEHPPVADASATPTLVVSPNGLDATVVLDGSRSSDVDGDPLSYAWVESGATLAHGVVALKTVSVGIHAILLEVSDGFASATNGVTVSVLTPAQTVERLAAMVEARVPRPGPLRATLDAALASINRGEPVPAINQLQAFQNKVRAQVAPIDPGLAELLIKSARQMIDALRGGDSNPADRPRARITSLTRQSNGAIRMRFAAQTAGPLVIEASTNLADWELIGVAAPSTDGLCEFEDTQAAGLPTRFYRARIP